MAIQVKCIEKFRDNSNSIVGYRLIDTNGKVVDVKSDVLKKHIKSGEINVVNLTLTSNDRLVSKESQINSKLTSQKQQKLNIGQQVNIEASELTKEQINNYVDKFVEYVKKSLRDAGIKYNGSGAHEKFFKDDNVYYRDTFIYLEEKYKGKEIYVSVLLTISLFLTSERKVCLDIYYTDTSKEIDKTPRLTDNINVGNISSSNKITIDKLVSCIMTL